MGLYETLILLLSFDIIIFIKVAFYGIFKFNFILNNKIVDI